MLILTRRIGESFIIGDNVTITILGIKGCQIRVGIQAPKDIPVHREEIYERIQSEKQTNAPLYDKSKKPIKKIIDIDGNI